MKLWFLKQGVRRRGSLQGWLKATTYELISTMGNNVVNSPSVSRRTTGRRRQSARPRLSVKQSICRKWSRPYIGTNSILSWLFYKYIPLSELILVFYLGQHRNPDIIPYFFLMTLSITINCSQMLVLGHGTPSLIWKGKYEQQCSTNKGAFWGGCDNNNIFYCISEILAEFRLLMTIPPRSRPTTSYVMTTSQPVWPIVRR